MLHPDRGAGQAGPQIGRGIGKGRTQTKGNNVRERVFCGVMGGHRARLGHSDAVQRLDGATANEEKRHKPEKKAR